MTDMDDVRLRFIRSHHLNSYRKDVGGRLLRNVGNHPQNENASEYLNPNFYNYGNLKSCT